MKPPARATVLLLAAFLAAPASARSYDLIYSDRIDVTLCENGCGITLTSVGWVLVNTGASPIREDSLLAARFTVVSSEPSVSLSPFVNNYGPEFAALEPGHARGAVGPENAFLASLIEPGEIFENIYGRAFVAFNISRSGTYEGPVRFDCVMRMNGEGIVFTVDADLHLGPHAIQFLTGRRDSSLVLPPPPPPPPTARAALDILPGDCPNEFKPRSHGTIPMAILGSDVLAVSDIDVASLRLEGIIAPQRTSTEDVGQGLHSEGCDCPPAGTDGIADLELKFFASDLASMLGAPDSAGNVRLRVTGRLADGSPLVAAGCVHLSADTLETPPDSLLTHMEVERNPAPSGAQVSYTLADDAEVTLSVYDVTGRLIETLVRSRQSGGTHVAEWQAGNRAPGVFFIRLEAAGRLHMRRFVLLK